MTMYERVNIMKQNGSEISYHTAIICMEEESYQIYNSIPNYIISPHCIRTLLISQLYVRVEYAPYNE